MSFSSSSGGVSLLLLKAICPFGPGNVPAQALWLIWIARRRLDSMSIAETAKPPNLLLTGIRLLILILSLFVVAIGFVILLSNDGYFIVDSPIFGGIGVI
jgi:hypothetical protein